MLKAVLNFFNLIRASLARVTRRFFGDSLTADAGRSPLRMTTGLGFASNGAAMIEYLPNKLKTFYIFKPTVLKYCII